METSGLDHITLTVSDLEHARQFYGDFLGFDLTAAPQDYADLVFAGGYSFMIGEVEIGLMRHAETPPGDRFHETRIGLDHLAFKAPNEAALHALAEKLVQAGIATKGVERFERSGKLSVTFRDPDNIQLEYWLDQPMSK
ncbi:MAG: VOC family protein [Chloroflexota bacterium]